MRKFEFALVSMLSVVGCAGPELMDGQEAPPEELTTREQGLGCAVAGDGQTTLRFINRCNTPVVFAGNEGMASGTLAAGAESCRNIGSNTVRMASRRYWGFRQGEDPGAKRYTLAEFTFNEVFYESKSYDWFNLSQVDAHNLPMRIIPYQLGTNTACPSQTRTCANNLLSSCPDVGKYKNSAGKVLSCVSPNRDDARNPVAVYFDNACPQAYSWSGDSSAMASCNAEDFDIVFCPAP